jgi:aldehyde:ferredoxin oxidoreductase
MDYNRHHPEHPIAGGLSFGDAEGVTRTLKRIAYGEETLLGHGVKRLSERLGETAYAMQCKGVELPVYLPETNPGYPFALAGGHMSMRTFLLYIYERETSIDYWEQAIVERGLYQIRDDMIGLCKFAGINDTFTTRALNEVLGLDLAKDDVKWSVLKTFIRGYALEKKQGFDESDYVLPERTYEQNPNVKLPYFITPEFFGELKKRVLRRFDTLVEELNVGC